jgi:hypothetical protein
MRIGLFVYFLTETLSQQGATAKQIEQCFRDCDLSVPQSISSYLSKGLNSKPRKFVKAKGGGYKLERHMRELMAADIDADVHNVHIPAELHHLLAKAQDGPGKEWLKEGMECFSIQAYRATLILVWLYTLDHLFEFILKHQLAAFNATLANHPDKKATSKVGQVTTRDHFTELPEDLFITICKTANIISADVKRILIERLGNRNSAAHPSGVVFTRARVVAFVEDLVLNVAVKYPI